MRVFACYVVSKLQRHWCPTFGALQPRNRRGQTGRYIFIYIDCWVLHPVARVSTNVFLKTTVRNGAETCSKLVHNKTEHRNIVAYGGFKKNINAVICFSFCTGYP
jgi:hypothetical protein